MKLHRVTKLKCLRTRKHNSKHKCEWNLSLVWLFLAHPFWALATFPVCFSVLSCCTNRPPSMGTKWSISIYKNIPYVKKQYMCRMMIILCQRDCNEQIEKLIRMLLYHHHHHHHHHHWLDSPWWALAFCRSFAHSSLSRATFFQFLTSNVLISWSTPSSHRSFRLLTLLTPIGLVLNIFFKEFHHYSYTSSTLPMLIFGHWCNWQCLVH